MAEQQPQHEGSVSERTWKDRAREIPWGIWLWIAAWPVGGVALDLLGRPEHLTDETTGLGHTVLLVFLLLGAPLAWFLAAATTVIVLLGEIVVVFGEYASREGLKAGEAVTAIVAALSAIGIFQPAARRYSGRTAPEDVARAERILAAAHRERERHRERKRADRERPDVD